MSKVLLIGGGGYVGTALTQHFLEAQQKVVSIDRFIYNNKQSIHNFEKHKNYQHI